MNRQTVRCLTLVLAIAGAGAFLALLATGVMASSTVAAPVDIQAATLTLAASPPITLPSPCWRVPITADGLYRISYDTLDGAGVPVSGADPDDIHLLWRGQEVALQEVGDSDATLEPGESFRFFGTKFHGSVQDEKHTDENVYWLYMDDTATGLRMSARSVAPKGGSPTFVAWYTATAHAEENLKYWARWTDRPGNDATWFWTEMVVRKKILTFTYPITLSALAPGAYDATLRVQMASDRFSDYVHDVRLSLNDTVVDEVSWLGDKGYTATLPVDSTLLQDGTNDVDITVIAPTENHDIYLDWIEIDYRRSLQAKDDMLAMSTPISSYMWMIMSEFSTSTVHLYDISHPLAGVYLTGAVSFQPMSYSVALWDTAPLGTPYLAVADGAVMDVTSPTIYYPANDLVNPAEGADEIIIVPTEFISAVQPLSDLRRSQGLRVHVVDVNDIYALFNGGIVHPEAIRSFVAHAYANWPGSPPKYLLLFGDGNMNPKGYNPTVYGEFAPTLIPPYLEFADPDQGEVAVDARYGDVDWDGMPEVMVGRIPAGTVQQAEGAVAKILAYESSPASAWMSRVLMVTDNGGSEPEGFEEIADDLTADFVPSQMDVHTIHLRDYCGAATPATQNTPCPSATLVLTQTWSQGAAMLTYVGHGGIHRWGHEKLLLNTQMKQLTNTTGLPFLLSLDCWDGNWMWPVGYPFQDATDARSIGEWATTVLTDRGAIAAFGPAGLGVPDTENTMARAMYQAMFKEDVYGLGELTQVGREAIAGNYAARTYTLLGDPAMELRILAPGLYTPLEIEKLARPAGNVGIGQPLTYTLVISNAGPSAVMSTIVVTDWLPIELTSVLTSGVGWTCDLSAHPVLTCIVTGGLAPGDTSQIDLITTAPITRGLTITNTAYITATGTHDPDETNNTASVAVTTVDVPITGLQAFDDSPTAVNYPTDLWATIDTGTNVTYEWFLGYGSATDTGQTIAYTYPAIGEYTAVVTATNSVSMVTATTTISITSQTHIHLPVMMRDYVAAPDLVVDDLIVTTDAVTVAVRNNGDLPKPEFVNWSCETSDRVAQNQLSIRGRLQAVSPRVASLSRLCYNPLIRGR